MTLIVSAASDKCVIQVADRRLTWTDGSYNDFAIKMICVTCQDAVFSMAYTGLAIIKGKRVDEILVDHLTSVHAGTLTLSQIIPLLQSFLSSTFNQLTLSEKPSGITLVLAGFYRDEPFFAWISNMEDEKGGWLPEIDDHFRFGYLRRNKEPINKLNIIIHGAEQASDVIFPYIPSIQKHFFHKDPPIISRALMNIIRRSSDHKQLGKYIGKNCLSSIVLPDGTFLWEDYQVEDSHTLYMPHFICRDTSYKKMEVWTGKEPPSWWTG